MRLKIFDDKKNTWPQNVASSFNEIKWIVESMDSIQTRLQSELARSL